MRRYQWLLLVIVLGLLACQGRKVVPAPQETAAPPRIIATPRNIPADYEILGQVQLSGKTSSDLRGLYQDLGEECKKMGGDLVINVQAGQGTEDRSETYTLPPGYGIDPYSPDYARPYSWGKGTIIRLKDEEKRKALQDAQNQGDVGKACAIVGLPYP